MRGSRRRSPWLESGGGGPEDGDRWRAELWRGEAMAAGEAGALEVDSARGWLERARERAEEMEGEVERLGVRGNRAERREMAGAVAGDGSARARLDPHA